MEFVATLFVLYLMQCVAFVPSGRVFCAVSFGAWRMAGSPGWRIHPLRPSATWFHASRFPLQRVGGLLHARSPASRWGWRAPGTGGEAFDPRSDEPIEVRGRLVRVGGRPFLRAATPGSANRMAERLRALAGKSREEITERLASHYAEAYSSERFREAFRAWQGATRVLGWICDSYVVFLFLGIPALILFAHEERGLLIAFCTIAGLHLVALITLARAHRRLHPKAGGERFELLLAAAFYPPILLRARGEFANESLGDFHPAAAAAVLAPEAERHRILRAEWLRTQRKAAEPPDPDTDLEREALLTLLTACDLTPEKLMAPPPRQDPSAQSFCPACAADYRHPNGHCPECNVDLIPYDD